MTKLFNIGLLLLLVVTQSCIEKYMVDIDDYEDILVVDGKITNEPPPYTIKLSLSSTVQWPKFVPYSGAMVVVSDNEGNEEVFTETDPGNYVSSASGMTGTIGRKYKVTIRTAEGEVYESAFQQLRDPVGIANVYAEIESRVTEDEYHTLYGYQFYVDTETAEADSTHLMWLAEGTYEYHSDFLIRYIFDHRKLTPFPNPDSLYTCYHTDNQNGFFTADLSSLSPQVLTRFPLNYVTTDTRKISVRYSLLVKQYTLDKQAYTFYNQVSQLNTEQGVLYAQQPYQIKGNVYNVENADDRMLGYFLVAGINEKRIFVNRPPSSLVEFYYGICVLDDGDYDAFAYIYWTGPSVWPLYVTTDAAGVRALPDQRCLDCRQRGGTIKKPDFWEDE